MKTFVMFLGFVLAFAFAVQAQDEKKKEPRKMPTPAERFAKMDTNGDKVLSLDEFVAGHKRMDAEKAKELYKKMGGVDNKLSLEQFTKAMEDHKGQHPKGGKGGKKPAEGK